MTVGEFYEQLDGYKWRHEQGRERDAWIVAHLLAPHRKNGQPADIDRLLGRKKPTDWDAFDRLFEEPGDDDEKRRAEVEAMRAARRRQPTAVPADPPTRPVSSVQ